MSNFDNRGDDACIRADDIWDISLAASHFCCKSKTALMSLLKMKLWKISNKEF